MSHTRKTTLAFILPELYPLDGFSCSFVSARELVYPWECYHHTSQLCRTDHDNVLHTRKTTLAVILSGLYPLDGFRCSFVSAPELEYPLVYHQDALYI